MKNLFNKNFKLLGKSIATVIVIIIRLYQLCISPFFPNSCRFYPTCSNYSIQAIKKYGSFKGLYKAIYRILRCNPFSSGGYDPV